MKNYKSNIFLSLGIFLSVGIMAQQTPRFSNYLFNKVIINPAAAGSNEYQEIMGSYRKQWVGFDGAPSTSFLSYDGSILQRRLGVGVQLVNDRVGALSSNGVMISAAPRVRLAREKFLSLGLSVGYFNNRLNGSELTFKDQNERAIPAADENVSVFDVKAGLYYKDDKYFGGISVFNFIEPKINYTSNSQASDGVLERHYYFMAGRLFRLNQNFDIVPSALYKLSENGQDQLDLNVRALYNNYIGAGISVRGKESISLMFELFPTPNFRFGYAYDISTNALAGQHSGSHEIMAAYRIIPNKNLTENPRFLFN